MNLSEKGRRQHLKRKLLQYQWLEEMGFKCSEEKERLFVIIKQYGYTLREIDEEKVRWKYGSTYREVIS